MHFTTMDWSIVFLTILFLGGFAYFSKRYVVSVADFLAANRCAGRYLLSTAGGVATLGAITIVAAWEMYYRAGFNPLWWSAMSIPAGLLLSLSGWVIYRFRATKALTMAQFFEIRYSRRFRVFAGFLTFLSGILNYGIFPAVTARVIIYFCDIPVYIKDIGFMQINITMAIVMFIMLFIAVVFVLFGGQLSVLITDFLQGQMINIAFLATLIVLIIKIGWPHLIEILKQAPPGESMLNPFDQQSITDFNGWYFVMQTFLMVYGWKAWQGVQGYNSSARSPHEARMAGILGQWRGLITLLLFSFAPICAYVILRSPNFSHIAVEVNQILAGILDDQSRIQMTVPVTLVSTLPIGVNGLLVAALIAAAISTDDSYLHSWGSIFIQDVVMPLKKQKLSPDQHIKWLKISIIGVAIFAWFFSMIFTLKEYIYMYMQITGAIYLGGAGAVIVGGLYWKRGTTAGAWFGMIIGSVLAVCGIVIQNILWPMIPALKETYPHLEFISRLSEEFPLNNMQMSFCSAATAALSYVIVSLLTKPDPDFDMDRMLHRGKFMEKKEHVPKLNKTKQNKLYKILDINEDFTRFDKIIYFSVMGTSLLWLFAFIIGCAVYPFYKFTDDQWGNWWLFKMSVTAFIAVVTVVWFIFGGIKDLIDLFKDITNIKRNSSDDGSVVRHHNLAEENN